MSDQFPPSGGRMDALNNARPGGYIIKPVNLTIDEARALIDSVFRSYGLEPADCIDENGWRVLSLGNAQGFAGIVEWSTGEPYLVVFAPLRQLPGELQIPDLYRTLLELNHSDTLSARFTINGDVIYVSLSRPIRGLDAGEVDEALRAVMTVADQADKWLNKVLGFYINQASLPASELPKVRMTPEEMAQMSSLLFACGDSARPLIRTLLEKWVKAGYEFDLGIGTLHLKIPYGTRLYTLAALRADFSYDNPLLILGWEGLRLLPPFPASALDKYQADIKKLAPASAPLAINESTAHLPLTKEFDPRSIQALVKVLDKLAKSVDHSKVDGARPITEPNIQATLAACDPRTAELFTFLIEEWRKTGESVLSNKVGRVVLKLKVEKEGLSSATYAPPIFVLASLVAPKKGQGPTIEVPYGLDKGEYPYLDRIPEAVGAFDGVVAGLPGFAQKGFITRLELSEQFERCHAEMLLNAMLALRQAVKKENESQ